MTLRSCNKYYVLRQRAINVRFTVTNYDCYNNIVVAISAKKTISRISVMKFLLIQRNAITFSVVKFVSTPVDDPPHK